MTKELNEEVLWEVRSYKLPRAFWLAFLEARNYWLRDDKFVYAILCPERRNPRLSEAFFVMDYYFDIFRLMEEIEEEEKKAATDV